MTRLFNLLVVLSIGSVMGLLVVPLLPESAQNQVNEWQSDVSAASNWLVNANDSTGTTDKISKITGSIKDEISTLVAGPTIDPTQLEAMIHDLVNGQRSKAGLAALRQDGALSAIARSHSHNMAVLGYFDHTDSLGQGPTDRAEMQGYTCRKDYGSYYTVGVAENIFQNWLFSSTTYVGPAPIKDYLSIEEIAESTVDGWMGSPGHRGNILESQYGRVGTGVAVSEDSKVYITQNFC